MYSISEVPNSKTFSPCRNFCFQSFLARILGSYLTRDHDRFNSSTSWVALSFRQKSRRDRMMFQKRKAMGIETGTSVSKGSFKITSLKNFSDMAFFSFLIPRCRFQWSHAENSLFAVVFALVERGMSFCIEMGWKYPQTSLMFQWMQAVSRMPCYQLLLNFAVFISLLFWVANRTSHRREGVVEYAIASLGRAGARQVKLRWVSGNSFAGAFKSKQSCIDQWHCHAQYH